MTPFLQDPDVTLHQGDALEVLRELPDESVHCVATSPPFFGLRDYGVDGQIGLEDTPELWAARLVEVFREARRVLRRDGSLWVECGDSYAHPAMGGTAGSSPDGPRGGRLATDGRTPRSMGPGLKQKDLIGQPFLLAFALRADGWYWRGCNIWAKPNAMPESAKDRCTVAHSYVLHFSKSARYFFDGDAIREENAPDYQGTPDDRRMFRPGTLEKRAKYEATTGAHFRARGGGGNSCIRDSGANTYNGMGRSPRSVWTIPTQGFPEAHFATWPEQLARRIILAAVPEQVCRECGKARERIVEVTYTPQGDPARHNAEQRAQAASGMVSGGPQAMKHGRATKDTKLLGFTDCGHNAYTPGVVLDPFAGSGTTLYVARKHNRRAIGIDLNPEYLEMAARRLAQQSLFALAAGEDTT